MFTGAMVALITPFRDGEVDYKTLEELVDFQLENGIDAIVPCGTTGESPNSFNSLTIGFTRSAFFCRSHP